MDFSRISDILRKIAYRKTRILLLVFSGLLTGLTLVFPKLGFLEWITMIPVGILLIVRASDKNLKLRSLYADGFLFFYSYYLVCYHWFVNLYPLEFIDGMTKSGALAVVIFAWFGLSLLQALMGGCVFVLAGLLFRCDLCERFMILRVFVGAGLWAAFEWSQTIGWWGVPWGRLPIGQSEYLVGLQTASWFGSYFVTFLIVAVNFLLAYTLLDLPKWKLGVMLATCLLVFQYGAGTLIWFTTDVTDGEPIEVACVQGNISSSDKWSNDSDKKTTEIYTKLIVEAAEHGSELVILPETAFPYDLDSEFYASLNKTFCDISRENGIYLLVGAYTVEGEKDSLNSLVCFSPEGERLDTVYSKRHLVPFGEYDPFGVFNFDLMGNICLGDRGGVIETPIGKIGFLICFESLFSYLNRQNTADGAELTVVLSNDSWFGDSSALYRHLCHSVLRAVESGRSVVCAANTGISCIISKYGVITASAPKNTTAVFSAQTEKIPDGTLNSSVGDIVIFVILLILLKIEFFLESVYTSASID
jgi:apolipoprotein N-acyltransferase